MSKPQPLGAGLQLPPLLDKKGNRSSTELGKALFSAVLRDVDNDASTEASKKWTRGGYAKQLEKNVAVSMKSREAALAVARNGIKWVHDNFEFKADEQADPIKLSDAMKAKGTFETLCIEGEMPRPKGDFELRVPYKGEVLVGDALLVQLDKWAREGVIELDCANAIASAVRNKRWLDLSDKYFVLLGASSAMGPLLVLLALGANVVAVDICPKDFGMPQGNYEEAKTMAKPRSRKEYLGPWAGPLPDGRRGLFAAAQNSCGKLFYPVPVGFGQGGDLSQRAHVAGCDLLKQTPQIKNWLIDFCRTEAAGKQVVVGAYAYLDGVLFVKISVAMDAIIHAMMQELPCNNLALAYLCTPTDCHLISAAAKAAIRSNKARAPLWQSLCQFLPKMNRPNRPRSVEQSEGDSLHSLDAIVHDQGPNYILAKRLQHWRAIFAREVCLEALFSADQVNAGFRCCGVVKYSPFNSNSERHIKQVHDACCSYIRSQSV